MIEFRKIEFQKNEIDYIKNSAPEMKKLIEVVGEIDNYYIPDPFSSLVYNIVFQLISFKTANKVWARFEEVVVDITPEKLLSISDETLRKCGLSITKIRYIKHLSEVVLRKEINLDTIYEMSDDEAISNLMKIKGIGKWTAEMFLIFSLNRKDIISYNDLAIRKGLKWLFQMQNEPNIEEFKLLKQKFSPYNTIASFYLWEITIRNYFQYKNIDEIN